MVKSLILMMQFLTRLPINISVDFDRDTIAKGTVFFPLIGMIVGGISAVVYYILSFVNRDAASLGAVLSIVVVTGGLHIDGLSDTADGFFSARSRERILEIMKDSRVGSFGVIAIIFDILFKYVLINNMDIKSVAAALILCCGAARMSSALLFTFGKSARPDGLGSVFVGNNTKKYFAAGLILFLVCGYFIRGNVFFISVFCTAVFSILFMRYSYRVIGGITGDVCGAVCELNEIIGLFIFLVVEKWI